ncbi:hypothetical protein CF111_20920 [Aeromonas sobria]|jgi:hypothetical protein|uniref:hypothetical protein n=1 Tax=Aeromonas sobria TaxID=646 RepID=UPI001118F795|nr:hypothetical protein [Aeromonas sobria]TNJ14497.1 hypothetical protein CF111_20920 [Aeromonas sobria]
MILVFFVALMLNYLLFIIAGFAVVSDAIYSIGLDDFFTIYVVITFQVTKVLFLCGAGVFGYYRRWKLFLCNIVGVIAMYAPFIV